MSIEPMINFSEIIAMHELSISTLHEVISSRPTVQGHPLVQEHKPPEKNKRARKKCVADECRQQTINRLRYSDNKFGETLKLALNAWFV